MLYAKFIFVMTKNVEPG